MAEDKSTHPKRNWLALIIATVLGIAATVGVGWYQLFRAENQAALAEQERTRAVRQALVSILEEHVLNDKPINLARLARLVDQRRRSERVTTAITTAEILEQAEFNILNTRYLPFERKEALKPVFDELYSDLSSRAFAPYAPEEPNSDLVNELASQIQGGNRQEALTALKRLQDAHKKDLLSAESGREERSLKQFVDQIIKDPVPVLLVVVVYMMFTFFFLIRRPSIIGALLRAREEKSAQEDIEKS